MQDLLAWTLNSIREENSDFSWMEEHRFDWTPLVKNACLKLAAGQTMLVLTDDKRKWFGKYILNSINDPDKQRPFLPAYDMHGCFVALNSLNEDTEISLLEDMLDISFPNGYFIWYTGDARHNYMKLVQREEDNFLWVTNDRVANSIFFRESDELLDIKLLQLYKLFDATAQAILNNEVDCDR